MKIVTTSSHLYIHVHNTCTDLWIYIYIYIFVHIHLYLKYEMATHSSILARKSPWGLSVRHCWATIQQHAYICVHVTSSVLLKSTWFSVSRTFGIKIIYIGVTPPMPAGLKSFLVNEAILLALVGKELSLFFNMLSRLVITGKILLVVSWI